MFLIGFFASPLPYVILVAAYLSGFALYYVKGGPAGEANHAELQKTKCIAFVEPAPGNTASTLILYNIDVSEISGSLAADSHLQLWQCLAIKLETPPACTYHGGKQFSALHIRPPPQA